MKKVMSLAVSTALSLGFSGCANNISGEVQERIEPTLSTLTYGDFEVSTMHMVNFSDHNNTATVSLHSQFKECKLDISKAGDINKGNCIHMVNSEGINIYCTPKKKICKTHKEIYAVAFSRGYKTPVSEQILDLESHARRACQSLYGAKNCDWKKTIQEMKDTIKECHEFYTNKKDWKEFCGG